MVSTQTSMNETHSSRGRLSHFAPAPSRRLLGRQEASGPVVLVEQSGRSASGIEGKRSAKLIRGPDRSNILVPDPTAAYGTRFPTFGKTEIKRSAAPAPHTLRVVPWICGRAPMLRGDGGRRSTTTPPHLALPFRTPNPTPEKTHRRAGFRWIDGIVKCMLIQNDTPFSDEKAASDGDGLQDLGWQAQGRRS